MNVTVFNILVLLGFLISIVALIKPEPERRLCTVSVLLVCVALLVKGLS